MCCSMDRTDGGTDERAVVGRMRKQLHSLPLSLPLGQLCPSAVRSFVRWRWPRSPLSARLMKTPRPPPPQRPPNEQTGGQLNYALSHSPRPQPRPSSALGRGRLLSFHFSMTMPRDGGRAGSEGRREGRAGLPSSRSAAEGGWLWTDGVGAAALQTSKKAASLPPSLARPLQSF